MDKTNVVALYGVSPKFLSPHGPVTRERLIRIEYSGGVADRISRASSLEGALKAVVLRIAHGEYSSAKVYDERFGHSSQAMRIQKAHRGITILWFSPKWRAVQ